MSPIATSHNLIATGNRSPNVRLCDMRSSGYSHTLIGHQSEILSCTWNPRSEFQLASSSTDQTIRVWDIRRAGALMILDQLNNINPKINTKYISQSDMNSRRDVHSHDGPINHLSYSRDGLFILSAGGDRRIRLWDAASGKNTMINYAGITVRHRINRFATSSCGEYLFVPNQMQVKIQKLV